MSHRIIAVFAWAVLLYTASAMVACSTGGNTPSDSSAGRADGAVFRLQSPGAGEQDVMRTREDARRNRLWVLTPEGVRVYDLAGGGRKLIRQIELPGWSVARFGLACMPDMVLDGSGSAFISSNATPRIRQIDADSFELQVHDIRLQGREGWDIGFGALAFAPDGTMFALASLAGRLWKIDVATASAVMVEPPVSPGHGCSFSPRFLSTLERMQQP